MTGHVIQFPGYVFLIYLFSFIVNYLTFASATPQHYPKDFKGFIEVSFINH